VALVRSGLGVMNIVDLTGQSALPGGRPVLACRGAAVSPYAVADKPRP
jgi:hypothetical protein